jgi:hypothetical protein
MRPLTKIIAPALVAALGLSAMAPASAHAAPRHEAARHAHDRHSSVRSDINDLRRDVDRAAARRAISQREANTLRREANQIQRLYASYARNGLSQKEVRTLERKVDRVHIALRKERRDRDGRRG